MKATLILSLIAGFLFAGMAVLNIHDYYYATDIPWREGDFRRVMSNVGVGLGFSVLCLLLSLTYLRRVK